MVDDRFRDGSIDRVDEHRARGRQGDLLLEDDPHQGGKAGAPAPEGWRAMTFDDGCEPGIPGGELPCGAGQ